MHCWQIVVPCCSCIQPRQWEAPETPDMQDHKVDQWMARQCIAKVQQLDAGQSVAARLSMQQHIAAAQVIVQPDGPAVSCRGLLRIAGRLNFLLLLSSWVMSLISKLTCMRQCDGGYSLRGPLSAGNICRSTECWKFAACLGET